MNRYLLATALLLVFSLTAPAEDCTPLVSEPLPASMGGVCPAPAEPPPVCPTGVASSSVPEVYYEVPVQRKVMVDEVYTAEVKRTKVEKEVRTRLIKPNSPRLSRVAKGNRMDVKFNKDVHREKTYVKPVRVTYTEEVTKTRKVPVIVEETKLVPAHEMRGQR